MGLTVVMTWPLTKGFGSLTLGPPGDNLEFIWKIWWFKHALTDLGVSPFFDPDIYYPVGFSLALGESTPANAILALPVTLLFDAVVAYNVVLFASFVLSAFGTYLLVRYWTGSMPAALLSGIMFAFCPYRTMHSAGHLPPVTTQWLPFLFLFVERLLRERKLRYGVLARLAYALTALSAWYYGLYTAVLMPVYILLRLRPWRSHLSDPFLRKAAACFVAVALAAVLPFLTPYLRLSVAQPYRHPFQQHLDLSASVANFVGPSLLHPVWGGWLRARWNPSPVFVFERSISLGMIPLGLAAFGLAKGRRHRPVQAVAGLGVAGLVLAFGPVFHLGGSMAKIPLPPGAIDLLGRSGVLPFVADRLDANLVAEMIAGSYTFLPLPGLLLYLFFPGFTSTRVWARFGVFPALAVAILAGWGLLFLFRWLARTLADRSSPLPRQLGQPLLGGLLSLLILFEFLSIVPSTSFVIRPRAVDLWLREQEGDFAIMQFPILPDRGPHLYYSIIHQKKLVLGYTSYVPLEFQDWIPILASFPSPESLRLLHRFNVRYILLDTSAYGDALDEVLQSCERLEDLRLVDEMEGIYLYELLLPVPPYVAQARVGDVGELLGYDLDQAMVNPGETLNLTLFWQGLGQTQEPYKVFTHLLNAEGDMVAQHDAEPCAWSCPTTGWVSEGIIVDEHPLAIGPQVQPGEYTMVVGMYDESTGERVPVYNKEGDLLPDATIVLGRVKVEG
jgi:hypothetical protein